VQAGHCPRAISASWDRRQEPAQKSCIGCRSGDATDAGEISGRGFMLAASGRYAAERVQRQDHDVRAEGLPRRGQGTDDVIRHARRRLAGHGRRLAAAPTGASVEADVHAGHDGKTIAWAGCLRDGRRGRHVAVVPFRRSLEKPQKGHSSRTAAESPAPCGSRGQLTPASRSALARLCARRCGGHCPKFTGNVETFEPSEIRVPVPDARVAIPTAGGRGKPNLVPYMAETAGVICERTLCPWRCLGTARHRGHG